MAVVMWTCGRKAAVLRRNFICFCARTRAVETLERARSSSAPFSAPVIDSENWESAVNSYKTWCREGESNPQKPKLGGF